MLTEVEKMMVVLEEDRVISEELEARAWRAIANWPDLTPLERRAILAMARAELLVPWAKRLS